MKPIMSGETSATHLLAWNRIQRHLRRRPILCDRMQYTKHYSRHQHPGIEYLFIRTGAGYLFYGDATLPFSGTTLVRLDAQQPHGMHITDGCDRWYVLYRPELLKPYARNLTPPLPGSGQMQVFDVPRTLGQRLNSCFLRIQEESSSQDPESERLGALYLMELLLLTERLQRIQAVGHAPTAPSPAPSAVPDQVQRILNYIEMNIAQPLSGAEIGEALHFSERYIYKLVRSATNQSLGQYIRIRRIARAKQLLASTDEPVYAIGASVGMPNTAHFCRVFRDETGRTPTEYRKEFQQTG